MKNRIDSYDFQVLLTGYVRYALGQNHEEVESVYEIVKKYACFLEVNDIVCIMMDIKNSPLGYGDRRTKKLWKDILSVLRDHSGGPDVHSFSRVVAFVKNKWN